MDDHVTVVLTSRTRRSLCQSSDERGEGELRSSCVTILDGAEQPNATTRLCQSPKARALSSSSRVANLSRQRVARSCRAPAGAASSTIRTGGSSAPSSRTPTTGNVLGPAGSCRPVPSWGLRSSASAALGWRCFSDVSVCGHSGRPGHPTRTPGPQGSARYTRGRKPGEGRSKPAAFPRPVASRDDEEERLIGLLFMIVRSCHHQRCHPSPPSGSPVRTSSCPAGHGPP